MDRRSFLKGAGTVTVTTLTVAGCLNNPVSLADEPVPSNSVTRAGIPSTPSQYDRPVLGSGNAPVQVQYFGNWKCPFCSEFATGYLGEFTEKYIQPGDVALQFNALVLLDGSPFLGADAVTAGHAGLSVWNNSPDEYWTYHEYLMKHQPPESSAWATPSNLRDAMETVGVNNVDTIISEVEDEAYRDELEAISEDAAELGVNSTPTVVVNGQKYSPLNNVEQLEAAVEQQLE